MTKFIKCFLLIGIGLVMAIFGYPFLHECGHCLFAWACGAEIIEFHITPIPNILCNLKNMNTWQILWIGSGGILFPFILSVLWHPKNFYFWYANFISKGISFLAAAISMIAVILFQVDQPMSHEDMTVILENAPELWQTLIGGCALIEALLLISMIQSKPLQQIENFAKF